MSRPARTILASSGFRGFADRDGRFFRALARNQRREWFAMHRREYEEGWLAPMKALLADVRARIDGLYTHHPIAEPHVFRIHRDVRFAKDKSPYKTHIGGYLGIAGGAPGPSAPAALYVHIAARELFVCAGHYMMDGPKLARFRQDVLDAGRGEALAAIVRKLTRAGFTVGSHHTLQRVPRGVDPEHPRADLLRRKGLIVSFPEPARALLVSPTLVDWIVTHVKRTVPLVEWLAAVNEDASR